MTDRRQSHHGPVGAAREKALEAPESPGLAARLRHGKTMCSEGVDDAAGCPCVTGTPRSILRAMSTACAFC
ncbi:hypothetical protein ACRAWG_12080 [Methylobacterium sp. P31]